MTEASETTADERALVRYRPDARLRLLFPDAFAPPAEEPDAPTVYAPPLRERARLALAAAGRGTAHALEREIGRGLLFLLFSVCMGAGAVCYFTLAAEPGWPPLLGLLGLLAVARLAARNAYAPAQLLTLALAFQLGLVAAKVETGRKATATLGAEVTTRVTGRVVALEYRDRGDWRITLDVLTTRRPRLDNGPARIRVTARDIPAETAIGGGLTGLVRLRPPSGPVRPGNYDFAFHAYFDGIGANGFFLGLPKLAPAPPPDTLAGRLEQAVARLRGAVSARIDEAVGGEDGNVAAALIAGERAGVSEETNENLRKAGLAHILSISGLHLALAAWVVMFTLRGAFALFPAFGARHPVKKYAAFLSLLSCGFYLALSGADIAAQRSYVMIAVMLSALLADRAAISMRNLAIAVIVSLIVAPHEALGPSFQMSFSATAALIAAFAWWSGRKDGKPRPRGGRPGGPGLATKVMRAVAGTAATSLVAGAASGVFAAYHFNNTAPLGILGNLLAMPAISLLVMPFAVFSLLAMPLQLEWWPLQIVAFGVAMVRHVAALVASISPEGNPGAIPMSSLLWWSAALVAAVVFTTRLRLLALPFALAGAATFVTAPSPDILVTEDAKLVAVRNADGALAVNRPRGGAFALKNWSAAYKAGEIVRPQTDPPDPARAFACADGVCSILLSDGRTLAYAAREEGREAACNIGDIVVLAMSGQDADCGSRPALLIRQRDLALRGALEIRLGAAKEASNGQAAYDDRLAFAIGPPQRPWHLYRLYSRAARDKAQGKPANDPAEEDQ